MNREKTKKEVSIRDLLQKTDAEIRQKLDELGNKEMSAKSHEFDKYPKMSIDMAARKHVEKARANLSGDPAAIRIMRVVLAAHRKDSSVKRFMENVKRDAPNLTMNELKNELKENDWKSFAAKGWWHRDERKFNTLKELVTYFQNLNLEPVPSDEDRLKQWAVSFDLASWKTDPIRQIRGIGLATVQHLRLEFGIDTVKPDTHVLQVLSKEFGAKVTRVEAIQLVEEIAAITNRKPREVDQIFVKYGSGGYLSDN